MEVFQPSDGRAGCLVARTFLQLDDPHGQGSGLGRGGAGITKQAVGVSGEGPHRGGQLGGITSGRALNDHRFDLAGLGRLSPGSTPGSTTNTFDDYCITRSPTLGVLLTISHDHLVFSLIECSIASKFWSIKEI